MCDHAYTAAVAFDERRPVLEHVTCLECLTRWKTYGAKWMVPVTKREVLKWWNRVLIAKGRCHEVVDLDSP